MQEGAYDRLVDHDLHDALRGLPEGLNSDVRRLTGGEIARRLGDAVAAHLADCLDDVEGDASARASEQLRLINGIIAGLRGFASGARLIDPPETLLAIHRGTEAPAAPAMGLADGWLFTAGRGEPALLAELRAEIETADGLDVLVSFITRSGVRKLIDVLRTATTIRGDNRPRLRLRIITTTYTGATEADALDELARLPGCSVRVSFDGSRTRLHAKAWILRRDTGFSTAYIGSANLSAAALMGGIEWTVKVTEAGQRDLWLRAANQFAALWLDTEFVAYHPDQPDQRAALDQALRRERHGGYEEDASAPLLLLDVHPRPFQQAMLDRLAAERNAGRTRNLVVAATGTGKTVVAALDYRLTCASTGAQPALLFIAHRLEILLQAQRVFRQVLRDASFGELLSGDHAPQRSDHLFATIDSVTARNLITAHGPDRWDTVIIDECHRMGPETRFAEIVQTIRPRILLGLTATPERGDGTSILTHFDSRPDGAPAVELRLWDALDQQLLAPFEYYGCDDDTDFSDVPWGRGGDERAELARIVMCDHWREQRARLVIDHWRRLAGDPRRGRAIAFCVDVAHAQAMAAAFTDAGIPACCVHGGSARDERAAAPRRLAQGAHAGGVAVVTTVDLYNEGIDIPQVDTLLLLRPTQSPVVFQQQLGRGLRHWTDGLRRKESCLVIDLVGRHRQEFRFDRLLGPITGLGRPELVAAVDRGFSALPPGCHIHLDQRTREQVLRNLRAAIHQTWRRLKAELRAYVATAGHADITLAGFIRHQGLELTDLYRADGANNGWSMLRRECGLPVDEAGPEDATLSRRLAALLHLDDATHLSTLRRVAEAGDDSPSAEDRLRLLMLAHQLDPHHDGGVAHFRERLARAPAIRSELVELLGVLLDRCPAPQPALEPYPLLLHAAYQRREILTALGWWTETKRPRSGEGVVRFSDRKLEVFFVTLDKSEGFHARIAYRDCALSPDQFQWQTQNSCGPDTPVGRRYLDSPNNGWRFVLFVRETPAHPFRVLGQVVRGEVHGDRPMTITWHLEVPMSAEIFQRFSALR